MNAYCEFYIESEKLCIHLECYVGNGRHFSDFELSEENTAKLKKITGSNLNSDLIKYLTKNYSIGNEIIGFIAEKGLEYTVIIKGYEDTSSDV